MSSSSSRAPSLGRVPLLRAGSSPLQALAQIGGSPAAPTPYHRDALLQGPRGGVFLCFRVVRSSSSSGAFFSPLLDLKHSRRHNALSPPPPPPFLYLFKPSGASVRSLVCGFCESASSTGRQSQRGSEEKEGKQRVRSRWPPRRLLLRIPSSSLSGSLTHYIFARSIPFTGCEGGPFFNPHKKEIQQWLPRRRL